MGILVSEDHRIGDRFEVLHKLGDGNFGVVYACRDIELSGTSPIALKILREERADSVKHRNLFENEMRWLYQQQGELSCPAIIAINHTGTHEGRPYFTMPCADTALEGLEEQILSARTAARVDLAARVVECLHQAMTALHSRDKAHRDIKPANILVRFDKSAKRSRGMPLSEDDALYLADLGLAKDLNSGEMASAGVGTLGYMAPELVPGPTFDQNADEKTSDLYSATMVVHYCLTGHVAQGAWRRDLFDTGIDESLVEALERGLDQDPSRRHGSAAEWGNDLLAQLRGDVLPGRRPRWHRIRSVVSTLWRLLIFGLAGFALLLIAFVAFGGSSYLERFGLSTATGSSETTDASATERAIPTVSPATKDIANASTTDETVAASTTEPASPTTSPTTEELVTTDPPLAPIDLEATQERVKVILGPSEIDGTVIVLDNGRLQVVLESEKPTSPELLRRLENELLQLDGVDDVRTDAVESRLSLSLNPGANLRLLLGREPITFVELQIEIDEDSTEAETLAAIATLLNEQPEVTSVEVAGFTDQTGSREANLWVSQKRANATADFLVAHGVDRGRITVEAYGPACPISNSDPELNRRVEVVVTATADAEGDELTACAD